MGKELEDFILGNAPAENTDPRTEADFEEMFGLKIAEDKLPEWPRAADGSAGQGATKEELARQKRVLKEDDKPSSGNP
jgi:hypothetical protein